MSHYYSPGDQPFAHLLVLMCLPCVVEVSPLSEIRNANPLKASAIPVEGRATQGTVSSAGAADLFSWIIPYRRQASKVIELGSHGSF